MLVQVVTIPWMANIAVVLVGAKLPSTFARSCAMVRTGGGLTLRTAKALFVVLTRLATVTKRLVKMMFVATFARVRVELVAPAMKFVLETAPLLVIYDH